MLPAESDLGPVGRVKVLLWCRYFTEAQRADSQDRFDEIGELLKGTPGLIGSELLASVSRPGSFVISSEWESRQAFDRWEQGPDHRGQTAPMRLFQDADRSPVFDVLEVVRMSSSVEVSDRY